MKYHGGAIKPKIGYVKRMRERQMVLMKMITITLWAAEELRKEKYKRATTLFRRRQSEER